VVCYHENQKICKHERQYTRGGWCINLDHYLYTLKRKPGALAGSQALASAPDKVKHICNEYFADTPKDFVELLVFLQDHDYGFDKATQAIDRLKQISAHDISLDKIKALCMQKNEVYAPVLNDDDQILQQSRAQLAELSLLLNY
jgi:hypothetical protein